MAVPSRFLGEIPEELVRAETAPSAWDDSSGARRHGAGAGVLLGPRGGVRAIIHRFEVGARVRHQKFGEGKVLDVEGEGAGAIVTVQFPGVVKRLALSYAPLEPVE